MSAPSTVLSTPAFPQGVTAGPPQGVTAGLPPGAEVLVLTSLDVGEAEHQLILRALERTRNNRTAAAALLGMHPRTLRRKMRAMHIAPRKGASTVD